LIRKHVEQQPVPPSKRNPGRNLPKWVDEVVIAALAKDPAARYGTVESFAVLFRDGIEGEIVAGKDVATRIAQSQEAARQEPVVAVPRPTPRSSFAKSLLESKSLRSWMWKLVAVMAVLNLLLAVTLYAADGRVPLLIAGDPSFYDGGSAIVAIDQIRIRTGPSLDSQVIMELPLGTEVKIAGNGVRDDARVWWPARVDMGGQVTGYIAQDGLRPTTSKGPSLLTELKDRLT
jgi:hypothetical protein